MQENSLLTKDATFKKYIKKLNHSNILISSLIDFVSWNDLKSIKEIH